MRRGEREWDIELESKVGEKDLKCQNQIILKPDERTNNQFNAAAL